MSYRIFRTLSTKAGRLLSWKGGGLRCFSSALEPCRIGKVFFESENFSAHKMLESRPEYYATTVGPLSMPPEEAEGEEDEAWCEFRRLSREASEGRTGPLSEDRYTAMCQELASSCHQLSDARLGQALLWLRHWPMCESAVSANFYKLWKALDMTCLVRRRTWTTSKILYFVDLWYHIHLTRMSDFVYMSMRQLCKKPNRLSPPELVQVLFYLNTLRTAHKAINMYELEARLEECLDRLSTEELGVAALGFFKTRTVIHGEALQAALIQRLIREADTVPEIALTSIAKVLRMSLSIPVWPQCDGLLDVLCGQMGRLSLKGCAHVGLVAACSQTYHERTLDLVTEKLLSSISQARLKDIEKVLYPLTALNYDPKTSRCVFAEAAAELDRPERLRDFLLHPKCLAAIVHYLTLRSVFNHKAIARVLDMEFIRKTYGRTNFMIGREVLSIDTCVEIECPDYSGPRLPDNIRNYLSKRYSTYMPDRGRKLTKHGAFVLEVVDTLEILLGKEFMACKYLLPNNSRADLVFRLDRESRRPLPIPEGYRSRDDFTGPVAAPPSDSSGEGDWRAVVLCSKNMLIRNRPGVPNGETAAKLRHLRAIGYSPIMITLEAWPSHSGQHQKMEYLKEFILGDAAN